MVAKLYFPEPESDAVQAAVSAADGPVCSEVSIAERASVASRKHAERSITEAQRARVRRESWHHVVEGYWRLVPCTREELSLAADLIWRCQGKALLRALDAVHLATCQAYRLFPLLTTDRVMLRAADVLRIPTQTV